VKNKTILLIIALVLTLAVLACGSSGNDIEVRESSEDNENSAQVNNDAESEESAPEPTATKKSGTARSNPAPAGSEVVADDMAFVISGSTRPADEIVTAGNMFNTEPESDQEYIFVTIDVTCQKSGDDKCTLYPTSNFTLIGQSGVVYEPEILLSGVEGLFDFLDTEFYGGSTISGSLPFIVSQTDTDLILIYDPFLGDTFFLAVP